MDDEGDLVTVDLDEEWAECVALWREARGADDADVCAQQQRALRLVVTLGAQDGSAVCLGQQRHPRQAFWDRDAQRDGHRHHHQYMHGRHGAMPGIRQLLAEWHAQTWRQGQEQKQQAGDEVEAESVKEGTPCCRRSMKHAGEHGPRCRVHGRKNADATDVPQAAVAEVCCAGEGCCYAVTRRHGTHCCHMCARGGGQHGPRCEQRHMETSDVEAAAPAVVGENVLESAKEGMPCCRRSVKHAGQHGPRCRVHARKSADATEAAEVPSQEEGKEEEEEDVTAGVPDAALLVCAGCSFEVTGVHATHCCVRCAKHAGQHGPRCEQKMPMHVEEDEDVVAVQKEEAVVCEEDSAGVTALRNMGFDITADVRAVLERHNGDVAAVLEEMM